MTWPLTPWMKILMHREMRAIPSSNRRRKSGKNLGRNGRSEKREVSKRTKRKRARRKMRNRDRRNSLNLRRCSRMSLKNLKLLLDIMMAMVIWAWMILMRTSQLILCRTWKLQTQRFSECLIWTVNNSHSLCIIHLLQSLLLEVLMRIQWPEVLQNLLLMLGDHQISVLPWWINPWSQKLCHKNKLLKPMAMVLSL